MPEMRGVRVATSVKFARGQLAHIAAVGPNRTDGYTVCDWPTMDDMTCEMMKPVDGPPTCLWCIVGKAAL